MYPKLFAQATAHVLQLPIVAMVVFIAVFALIVVQTMRRKPVYFAEPAALPLELEAVEGGARQARPATIETSSPEGEGSRHG